MSTESQEIIVDESKIIPQESNSLSKVKKINLTAIFRSQSREERNHAQRNITSVPTPGRYRIKFSEVDKHVSTTS